MGQEIQTRAFAFRAGENWNLSPSCGRPSFISPHKTIRDNALTHRLSIEIYADCQNLSPEEVAGNHLNISTLCT